MKLILERKDLLDRYKNLPVEEIKYEHFKPGFGHLFLMADVICIWKIPFVADRYPVHILKDKLA